MSSKFAFLACLFFLFAACTERRQENLVQEAEEKIQKQEYMIAGELLKKAIAANPESKPAIKALYKLGFLNETYLKEYEAALFNYQEFMRLSQDRVAIYEVLKKIANIQFEQKKDNDQAIAAYKKLITYNPESLETDFFQFRIGLCYFRQNNFDQARIEWQAVLDKFPKSQLAARTRYEIANSYYMEAKYEIAIEAAKQVIRSYPQNEYAVEAQFLIGQCYESQEKYEDALREYEAIQGKYSSGEILKLRIAEMTKKLKEVKRAPRS